MAKIIIRGLEVNACHGVMAFEKNTPQPFVFDLELYFNIHSAAASDNVEDTVNYASVCDTVAEVAEKNSFNLIEKLLSECAYAVLDGYPVDGLIIAVHKPQAPVGRKISSVGAEAEFFRETAYLSLGSSMGDKGAYIKKALILLNATGGITVKKVSSLITTPPYGGVAVNEFVNCAAEIETYLAPEDLLKEIHRIEAECGRVRLERWGDRTLDIDIIFFGDKIISAKDLKVPHPEYSKRDFVLTPLKEIAPDFICPDTGKKLAEL